MSFCLLTLCMKVWTWLYGIPFASPEHRTIHLKQAPSYNTGAKIKKYALIILLHSHIIHTQCSENTKCITKFYTSRNSFLHGLFSEFCTSSLSLQGQLLFLDNKEHWAIRQGGRSPDYSLQYGPLLGHKTRWLVTRLFLAIWTTGP